MVEIFKTSSGCEGGLRSRELFRIKRSIVYHVKEESKERVADCEALVL